MPSKITNLLIQNHRLAAIININMRNIWETVPDS